ncbi:MAG: hypothetical protein KF769_15575 [Parvibaculum sp.]|nr:hypothetical protein [Parvibaculum sp.]
MCIALSSILRARAGLLSCLLALGLPLIAAMPALAASVYTEASFLKHPRIGDAQLDAWQEEIIGRHAQMSNNPDRWFIAATSIACDMSEETKWKIAVGKSKEAIDRDPGLSDGAASGFDNLRVTLIEGTCRQGRPEGPFVAVAEMETSSADGGRETARHRVRIEGTMRGGELEGELRSFGFWKVEAAEVKGWQHVIEIREKGLRQAKWIEIDFSAPGDDGPPLITTISRPPSGAAQQATSELVVWIGEMLYMESTMFIRWLNGWVVIHPVLTPSGEFDPPMRQRICFQRGKETEEEWLCDPAYGFALKAHGSNEASLRERFSKKIAELRQADLHEAIERAAARPSSAAARASAEAAAQAEAKAEAERLAAERRRSLAEAAREVVRTQQNERHKERDELQARIRDFRFPDTNCGSPPLLRVDAPEYEVDEAQRRVREWNSCLEQASERDWSALENLVVGLGGQWSKGADRRISRVMPTVCECDGMIGDLIRLANERVGMRSDDVERLNEEIRRFNRGREEYFRRLDASRQWDDGGGYYYEPPPAFTPQTLPQPQPYVIPGYR